MATASLHGRMVPALAPPAPSNGLSIYIPASARTLTGFRAWVKSGVLPEKMRVAFINGEIYLDMPNEELETHVLVKAEIDRVLMNLNRVTKSGKFYTDGVLVTNEAANISNNPEALFIFWETLRSGKVRLVPRRGKDGPYTEVLGTADWLLEVVSDSSVVKDQKKLRAAYHRAGVSEYWLVDARGTHVDFQILVWRKKGYVPAAKRGGWQYSPVFGRSFRLVRERDRMGLWEYTLEVRPE
jgi:Uma2 family endonuclease